MLRSATRDKGGSIMLFYGNRLDNKTICNCGRADNRSAANCQQLLIALAKLCLDFVDPAIENCLLERPVRSLLIALELLVKYCDVDVAVKRKLGEELVPTYDVLEPEVKVLVVIVALYTVNHIHRELIKLIVKETDVVVALLDEGSCFHS